MRNKKNLWVIVPVMMLCAVVYSTAGNQSKSSAKTATAKCASSNCTCTDCNYGTNCTCLMCN